MEVYRINTVSCFLAIKHAGAHMTAQRYGSIILTSSAASLRANAGAISYSASKAAVNNLAQTAANAFAGTGVRVNAVLPGLVETQLTRKVFEDARARGVEGKIGHVTPLKRPGRADEIAAAVAFLASDDSSYVDGQLLSVDGGRQQHASFRAHRAAELSLRRLTYSYVNVRSVPHAKTGGAALDFELPKEITDKLAELDAFIEAEIKPLERENMQFFDHRRENARTDWDHDGRPRDEWRALISEMERRADKAGHLRYGLPKSCGGSAASNLADCRDPRTSRSQGSRTA